MARNQHLITALDVGTTKVCALIADAGSNGVPKIVGVGISPCTGLKKGVVVDIEDTTSAVRSAIESAEKMAGQEVHSVVVGVTGEHIACLNSKNAAAITHQDHEISEKDVERLLESARVIVLPPEREIIHVIPRAYSIDGQSGIRTPVGMHGSRLEVETHIVTGLSSFVRNVVKCVHEAGWATDATVVEPIATGECVLSETEKDLGACLVDIGGGSCDVAIYFDGEVYYSSVIPVGGNHLTRDIAVGLRTTLADAERIKCEYVSDPQAKFTVHGMEGDKPRELPAKVLAEIVEARMVEVCHLVADEIQKAGCEDRLPAGVVFTGGGSRVRGFEELAMEALGMRCRLGLPTGVDGPKEVLENPSCATAVGLVLYCSRMDERRLDDTQGANPLVNIVKSLRQMIAKVFDFR